ncbi:hypothetical protein [Stenotrophomonas sp. NRRL B-14846]
MAKAEPASSPVQTSMLDAIDAATPAQPAGSDSPGGRSEAGGG